MKIARIRATPLLIPFKDPYHWALGVDDGATLALVEVESDDGIVGVGESIGQPTADVVAGLIEAAGASAVGESPYDVTRLINRAHLELEHPMSTPRFANQVFAGLDMALWDLIGKANGLPVHRLLGGAVRPRVQYFAFPQGDTADELAEAARRGVEAGFHVFYIKVGRGEEIDIANVAAVREAIGDRRLRLDANEAWNTLTAVGMARKLAPFEPEFIEQPTPRPSIEALAHVRAAIDIPVAADQAVYTPAEVFEVCRQRAADVVVLGVHEAGGLLTLKQAAAVAETAGIPICLHGFFETGVTTCASLHVAATIQNLDDGNQIMPQLLVEDIVATPDLTPRDGDLALIEAPGFGFELDRDAVARAAERHRKRRVGAS